MYKIDKLNELAKVVAEKRAENAVAVYRFDVRA